MTASSSTVGYGIDFVYRIQSEYPFLISTADGVAVIGSRLTQP
jgi:hypothetical protein